MPTEPATIREHWERVKKRHAEVSVPIRSQCSHCQYTWPCPDYTDALAALRLLNEAPATTGRGEPTRCVLIPDPDPVCPASSTEGANQ